jgi:hypothetical protein
MGMVPRPDTDVIRQARTRMTGARGRQLASADCLAGEVEFELLGL